MNDKRDGNGSLHRIEEYLKDVVAFPHLVKPVGGAAEALPRAGAGASGSALGQTVTKTINDVLGWKSRTTDPKGLVGALNACFTSHEQDGHVSYTWKPRTYAVQTDLAGGISGAQASLYTRAREALDDSIPLLEGLYPLDTDHDAEDVDATRALVRNQFTALVEELGAPGGPRVPRVEQYFDLLLGEDSVADAVALVTNPDDIEGSLGQLRQTFGLQFSGSQFVNTIEEEQNLSNFRILADYITSLAHSWLANRDFFKAGTGKRFYGTQLVHLSRQLSVIGESVDEVRDALDSVYIDAAERTTIEIEFDPPHEPMFLEEFLGWIQTFATHDGPQLIEDGGKLGVANSFKPIIAKLHTLLDEMLPRLGNPKLPDGLRNPRVRNALESLRRQVAALKIRSGSIERNLPVKKPFPAKLVVFPQQVDFGKVPKGEAVRDVMLFNAGDAKLSALKLQTGGEFHVGKLDHGAPPAAHEITIDELPARSGIHIKVACTAGQIKGRRDGKLKASAPDLNDVLFDLTALVE